MMSLQNKLQKVGEALADVVENTYHYWRQKMSAPFLVWAEDGEDASFNASNKKGEQQIHGTADYFTKEEYDANVDAIQQCFEDMEDLGWRLNSVQYEEDTNLIHYEWEWWVI